MNNSEHTALEILKQIRKAGFTAYFAGGSVRDRLLGRPAKDYDIATSALPEQIEALFPKTVAVGKAFGVIVVVEGNTETEVATFREDAGYQDGRRPDSVYFCGAGAPACEKTADEGVCPTNNPSGCGAEEDAKRRDFTVNGMFYDPLEDKVIDYVGGKADLEKKIIRAIGNPEKRFAEDHLRMLRAVRFAHTLGFEIDPATRAAIRKHAPDLAKISAERIENEFSRTLTESLRPGDALKELVELGLMEQIIPEILPMIGQEQPPEFHPEGDVFVHTCLMLNLMKTRGAGAPACENLVPRGAGAPACENLVPRGAGAPACEKTADEGVCPTKAPNTPSPFRPVENGISKARRRLPHWQQDNRIYFITFRTSDSLPQVKTEECDSFEKKDDLLNKGHGECLLRRPECRVVLEETLNKENSSQYELLAYVIMPNHVHVLVRPFGGLNCSKILQAWKSVSAHRINQLLSRKGSLWLDESFDHIVRTPEHLHKFTQYIQDNPARAHLSDNEYSLFVAQVPSPAEAWQTGVSAPPNSFPNFGKLLAYTVLLHDVGKPATAFMGVDRLRFHGHERKSAEMAEGILRRLKLPTKEIKQILTAIDGHMRFKDVQKMNKSTLRKLMGSETFDLELELHRVDCSGSHGLLDNYYFLLEKAEEMKNEPILPERWITGKDLKELGVPPGPRMGELIKTAYDAQLEGRFANRDELLKWLKTIL